MSARGCQCGGRVYYSYLLHNIQDSSILSKILSNLRLPESQQTHEQTLQQAIIQGVDNVYSNSGFGGTKMGCCHVTRKWQSWEGASCSLQSIMAATQDMEHRQISSNLCVRSSTCGFIRTEKPQPRSFPRSGGIAEPRNIVSRSFLLYDARPRIDLDQHPNHPIAGKSI